MRLLKIKKIWNSLFGKNKKPIDWEAEGIFDYCEPYEYKSKTNYLFWYEMYLTEQAKYKALIDWANKNNKQLYLDGGSRYGYKLEIKDKRNEITESK